jgi:hypothetical protein
MYCYGRRGAAGGQVLLVGAAASHPLTQAITVVQSEGQGVHEVGTRLAALHERFRPFTALTLGASALRSSTAA